MKVCTKVKEKAFFIKGNLYKAGHNDYIFMYTGDDKGACLNTGYGNAEMTDISLWIDVTDKYCFQEI